MSKISESIFDDGNVIIPMAEVQHIERRGAGNLMVVMKSSTWNKDTDDYNNAVYLPASQAQNFKAAWCHYRAELEGFAGDSA